MSFKWKKIKASTISREDTKAQWKIARKIKGLEELLGYGPLMIKVEL
jgi:hypothetical protein